MRKVNDWADGAHRRLHLAVAGLLFVLAPVWSVAAESRPGTTPPSERGLVTERLNPKLRYDLPVDVGVTLGAGALALSLELLSSKIAPSNCRWCDRDSSGHDTLNGFDSSIRNALRWSNTSLAGHASDITGFGLAPLAGVGLGLLLVWHDNRLNEFPIDALIVAESTLIAMNINQVTKLAIARERPFVHVRTPEERAANRTSEDNASFYSGHTSFAFSLAAAAGTVASMRRYRLAPVVWATGMAVAAATGYFRIAADRHYATDVIGGAVFGSAIGFAIPYFAHRPTSADVQLTSMPVNGGTGVMLVGTW
jgi:membrane-associated phospholipid phosphatase